MRALNSGGLPQGAARAGTDERMETTKVWCELCKVETWAKPNGDCPTCGRLITVFPGAHLAPKPIPKLIQDEA